MPASAPVGFNQSLCALTTHPLAIVPETGGASRDRTDDPLLAKQVLSQLSYGPVRDSLLDAGHLCGRLDRQLSCLYVSKGGDPAAPSDTATLLRLHPSHESLRGNRPPCG